MSIDLQAGPGGLLRKSLRFRGAGRVDQIVPWRQVSRASVRLAFRGKGSDSRKWSSTYREVLPQFLALEWLF